MTKETHTLKLLASSTSLETISNIATASMMLNHGTPVSIVLDNLNVTKDFLIKTGLLPESEQETNTYLIPVTAQVQGYIEVRTDDITDLVEIRHAINDNSELTESIEATINRLLPCSLNVIENSAESYLDDDIPELDNPSYESMFLISKVYNQGKMQVKPIMAVQKRSCKTCDEFKTCPYSTGNVTTATNTCTGIIEEDETVVSEVASDDIDDTTDPSDILDDDVNDDVTNELNKSDVIDSDSDEDMFAGYEDMFE